MWEAMGSFYEQSLDYVVVVVLGKLGRLNRMQEGLLSNAPLIHAPLFWLYLLVLHVVCCVGVVNRLPTNMSNLIKWGLYWVLCRVSCILSRILQCA